jgi:hypothetical protein
LGSENSHVYRHQIFAVESFSNVVYVGYEHHQQTTLVATGGKSQ